MCEHRCQTAPDKASMQHMCDVVCLQASELASAVADMLNAAGMPLDLDKQQLLQTALAANAQLQQVRHACTASQHGLQQLKQGGGGTLPLDMNFLPRSGASMHVSRLLSVKCEDCCCCACVCRQTKSKYVCMCVSACIVQASSAVAELRQEAARKDSELEAARGNWQCRVCFGRDVEQAFVGCGHMYCGDCMPSLPKCPVCRKPSQKIRLYR